MSAEEEKPSTRLVRVLSIRGIVTAVIAFGAGIVFICLVNNLLAGKQIVLSTQSLVALVFTVALGAASVILALIAIGISRNAEEALIRRSEEGVRLQNETFLRTNDVLSTIRASTGVTEKRIEDMISGRAGVIAKEVVERSLPEQKAIVTKEIAEKITKDIANSLKEELGALVSLPPTKAEGILTEKAAKQKRTEEIRTKWKEFRDSIVERVKKFSDVKILSEAYGDVGAEDPSKFWDAMLEIGDRRVAIDAGIREQIDPGGWGTSKNVRVRYARRLIWRIQQDGIVLAFAVFDENVWEEGGIAELASLFDEFNERDSQSRIVRLFGDPDSLAEQIHSISLGN